MGRNGRYGVKSVKRPALTLPPHPRSCDLDELDSYVRSLDKPLAIDLFSGAGGTSLGLEKAGFDVVLGVDLDESSIATHSANFGGSSVLADLSLPDEIDRIVEALSGTQIDLVTASPPCQPFSRAGRSKIRSLARDGEVGADGRRELWRSVIDVVERIMPRAVLVENVPGMTQGDDVFIVAELIEHLEELGFDVHARRLSARQHGVPQLRERIFIVGIERGAVFEWPPTARQSPTLEDAISDLPPVDGGDYPEFCEYEEPRTVFQRWARSGVEPGEKHKVYDHFARAVRDDDLEAFRLMNHATKYSDLPERLRRYRSDIFDDKYKRLHWNDVSRTITAHIAKDGYWYIHPEQHRTLTIRETARIQTFPDWFRFAGPPSHAFRQIGNAVPPLLAAAVGRQILKALRKPERQHARLTTCKLSALLATWIESVEESEMAQPWRRSGNLWHTLLGMVLFERAKPTVVRNFWPTFTRRWNTPQAYLSDGRREAAVRAIGRGGASELLARIARALTGTEGLQEYEGEKIEGLSWERLAHAATLCGMARAFQPTPQTVRIAERISGESRKSSRIDDQLALVRFIGTTHTGQAYGAVLEVGDRFCRPTAPRCQPCPLSAVCATGQKRTKEAHPLLFSAYD